MTEPVLENTTQNKTQNKPHKKSSLRSNLVLALTLTGLCFFVYWYEFLKKPEREKSKEAKTKLLVIDQNQEIENVKIINKEKNLNLEIACRQNCKLNDTNGQWEIITPLPFKADASVVTGFVSSTTSAHIGETIQIEGEKEAVLKHFGLNKEKRDEKKIELKLKNESVPHVVHIGDMAVIGDNLYAYVEGPVLQKDSPPGEAYILPSFIKNNIERSHTHWRIKRLFDFATSEVESLTLTNPSGKVELKKEQGNWFVFELLHKLSSRPLEADNESIDTFLTGVAFLNAQDYVSDDKKKDKSKFKLTQPKYVLEVGLSSKTRYKLEIFEGFKDKASKTFATLAHKDLIIELDKAGIEKFKKKASEFRFKNLISAAEKTQIRKIKLTLNKKGLYEFETTDGTTWKISTGTIDAFDPTSLDLTLTKIGSTKISEFLGKKTVPSGSQELSSWTLLNQDGKVMRSFTIYHIKDDHFVLLPSKELAKLDRIAATKIPSKLTDFQKVTTNATIHSPTAPPKSQAAK